ncbi:ribosomal protein S18 acetylase RimI-like enzyme [Peribacillus deserti]|uniref:Ribosomal protein S18 acetylase RimI-like enzyme n=1 Tax=Peribacillus deserti TaxID=673318 RepID=A0ABS2QMK9_9BACI|nr:GNAT family N-acetyltransferase [Peribacillus deserti]MBM7694195.1 ribosomal protein S18 acetylase RimI-like enzyme [Peribacillus deserti]
MKIYQATINDLDGISEIFNLYRVFYEQPSDLKAARAFITERLINRDSIIFTAVKEGRYAGFTQLYPSFSSVSMKRSLILNDLYVHENARKLGVGKQLLDAAKEYAIKSGAKGLSLQTANENTSAQSLYEKYGYQQETEFISYNLIVSNDQQS